MKKISIILLSTFLLSCDNKSQNVPNNTTLNAEAEKVVDSVLAAYDIEQDPKSSFLNQDLTKNSPVQVLKANFTQDEYSNYKGVTLKYKNVSDKTIDAIRFEWYGENSFSEPADMGTSKGKGGGFTDTVLKAGQTRNSTWDVLSSDGKTIIGARAYEVVFADGTKWSLR